MAVSITVFRLDTFMRVLRPALTVLRPVRFEKKKNSYIYFLFLCFNVFRQPKNCKLRAHVFIDHSQNCAQILFRSRAGLHSNCGRSHVKICPTWSFTI